MVGKLVRESDEEIKGLFESLLKREHIYCPIDEQIEEKQYEALLLAKGFTEENIRKYGFAFEGKKVLIG